MPATLPPARNYIFPALVTPLDARGALDSASTERLIDHLYRAGVGGLYVTGTTGEGVYHDVATRQRVVELAVAASRGRGQVVVHVGAIEGPLALHLARHAAEVGADAVASIPPCFGGYSFMEIREFYRQLSASSPLPVVAYYIPTLTKSNLSVEEVDELLGLPNVAGIKWTNENLYLMGRVRKRLREGQVIFNGADEQLAFGLAAGAHGGIGSTYNVLAPQIVAVAAAVAAGKFHDALPLQAEVSNVVEHLLAFQGLASTKQVLYWQGLIDSPTCVFPRATLSPIEQDQLRKRIAESVIADTLVRG